jgi:hypothetical protein
VPVPVPVPAAVPAVPAAAGCGGWLRRLAAAAGCGPAAAFQRAKAAAFRRAGAAAFQRPIRWIGGFIPDFGLSRAALARTLAG